VTAKSGRRGHRIAEIADPPARSSATLQHRPPLSIALTYVAALALRPYLKYNCGQPVIRTRRCRKLGRSEGAYDVRRGNYSA
jgi:hypothetical protein